MALLEGVAGVGSPAAPLTDELEHVLTLGAVGNLRTDEAKVNILGI